MKRIFLTGGTSGLGLAIAKRLVSDGHSLQVLALDPAAKWTEAAGASAEKAGYHQADIADAPAAGRALLAGIEAMGGIDVLINNAGVMAFENAAGATEAGVRKHLAVNLEAPIHLCSAVAKFLTEHQAPGHIINISSVAGIKPTPKLAVYSATKAGLIHYTRSLAAELAEKNIRANVVCPGAVQTNLTNRLMFEMIKKSIPLKQLQTAEEIAGLVAWLVSDEARSVTGSVFSLDGGMSL